MEEQKDIKAETASTSHVSNSVTKPVLRDENGRLMPGTAPVNPAGRPAGTKSLTNLLRDFMRKRIEGSDYTYEEEFIKKLIKKSIVDGDMRAIEQVYDRMEGKPQQTMDVTTGGEKITKSEYDIEAMAREIEEGLKKKKL